MALAIFLTLIIPRSHASAIVTASAFSLPSVSGNSTVSLSLRHGHPAVINFFAAWCVPCRRELPRFSAAAKGNKDITFIGIDDQDSRSQARDLIAATGVAYPTAYDPEGKVAPRYGITTGLPSTVFIDANGNIVHTQFGEISNEELNDQLHRLVSKP